MARIAVTGELQKARVRVRQAGDCEWMNARVVVAASDGGSLGLRLDGPVGGRRAVTVLPLLYDAVRGVYVDALSPDQYELELLDSAG